MNSKRRALVYINTSEFSVIYLPGDELVARRDHVVLERSVAGDEGCCSGSLSQLLRVERSKLTHCHGTVHFTLICVVPINK
jgi:hypothetical protein